MSDFNWYVYHGDCLEVLKRAPDAYFDSMVTDPPAGIDFMHKDWDCFRRRHNPKDVGRDSVMGRMSEHAPHSYGESDRGNFIAAMTAIFQETLRVLKPGAHALVWALPRTSHWTATALEDAGFEIRDICHHHFGQGFPKSQDVGKFIDKLAGAEREVLRVEDRRSDYDKRERHSAAINTNWREAEGRSDLRDVATRVVTAPATEDAKAWDGWGTALKPATEHWILARKRLSESSIARNVLAHGTGALNIDACRVERASDDVPGWHKTGSYNREGGYLGSDTFKIRDMPPEEVQERCGGKGRWPTNLLLSHSPDCVLRRMIPGWHRDDELVLPHVTEEWECVPGCPVAELDRQSGQSQSRASNAPQRTLTSRGMSEGGFGNPKVRGKATYTERYVRGGHDDSGGASRFFPTFLYFAKPSRSEREKGLDQLPERTLNRVNAGGLENEPRWAPVQVKNSHPTVKGIPLCRWLVRLITPPGGLVLDPFCGSGSIGCATRLEGMRFVGIEQDPQYCEIAKARITYWDNQYAPEADSAPDPGSVSDHSPTNE